MSYNLSGDNMNEQKKLTIQMAFFFLIVFVTFGAIVVKEKSTTLFMPKIEKHNQKYQQNISGCRQMILIK